MSSSYIVYSRFPTGEKRTEFARDKEQLYSHRQTCAALGFTVHRVVDNFPKPEPDPVLRALAQRHVE